MIDFLVTLYKNDCNDLTDWLVGLTDRLTD
jgi:hypothetical protein